jgi:hypothetical protein
LSDWAGYSGSARLGRQELVKNLAGNTLELYMRLEDVIRKVTVVSSIHVELESIQHLQLDFDIDKFLVVVLFRLPGIFRY